MLHLHREIDRLTDADADVRAINRLLSVRHGRYAPVLSDIAFDHFLCLNWEQLMPTDFCALPASIPMRYSGPVSRTCPYAPPRYVDGHDP